MPEYLFIAEMCVEAEDLGHAEAMVRTAMDTRGVYGDVLTGTKMAGDHAKETFFLRAAEMPAEVPV